MNTFKTLTKFLALILCPSLILNCANKDSSNNKSIELSTADNLTYPIVDTHQSIYYGDSLEISEPSPGSDYYGQDAQYDGYQPSLTDNKDGTITDNVTGLMWSQSPDMNGDGQITASDKLSYNEAIAKLKSLKLAGYTDWRLPTIKELYSLIDFRGIDPSGHTSNDTSDLTPFIDTDYFDFAYGDTYNFERIIDSQYLTTTFYVDKIQNLLFGVNFADGRIKGYGLTLHGSDKTFFVIFVRGNKKYGVNNFTNNNDGTISDSATGLMWSQDDSGKGMTWKEALKYAEDSELAGYSDWRLPNVKELQSIVDYTRSPSTSDSPAINDMFNSTSIINEVNEKDYPYIWSSTTHGNFTSTPGSAASYVSFGRAMGYMPNEIGPGFDNQIPDENSGTWMDVHGAGSQKSDPKVGDTSNYPYGHGPQGDAIRIYNYVRLVRNIK